MGEEEKVSLKHFGIFHPHQRGNEENHQHTLFYFQLFILFVVIIKKKDFCYCLNETAQYPKH